LLNVRYTNLGMFFVLFRTSLRKVNAPPVALKGFAFVRLFEKGLKLHVQF